MDGVLYWIGQGFGVIAIALGFLSYQLKTQRQLIIAQTATAITFCIHYALIGAWTGMAMNVVSALRGVAYYARNKKGSQNMVIPILFAVVIGAAGLLTWEAWYSVFVFLGLVINTLCMAFSDPQKVRASILITSPLVLVYDILAFSIGGAVYESVAVISAAIGLLRMYKMKKDASKNESIEQ